MFISITTSTPNKLLSPQTTTPPQQRPASSTQPNLGPIPSEFSFLAADTASSYTNAAVISRHTIPDYTINDGWLSSEEYMAYGKRGVLITSEKLGLLTPEESKSEV